MGKRLHLYVMAGLGEEQEGHLGPGLEAPPVGARRQLPEQCSQRLPEQAPQGRRL